MMHGPLARPASRATSVAPSGTASIRRVLITGCGRSGTKYTSFLLRRLGLDVPHERVGRDGIASWYLAVDAARVPFGAARGRLEFEQAFQQVRHPLRVIASAATFKEATWRFICEHVPVGMDEPLLLRSARYWHYWNLEAGKIADWRYRIEDLEGAFAQLCSRLEVKADPEAVRRLSSDVNTRSSGWLFHVYEELCERLRLEPSPLIRRALGSSTPAEHEPVSWSDLQRLDSRLAARIREQAREYGYEP